MGYQINNENMKYQFNEEDVLSVLKKRILDSRDFQTLLSDAAVPYLEPMAKRVYSEHINHFGKAVGLYTPLYISNFCINQCVYCSYNVKNTIKRHKLNLEAIEKEAIEIAKTGLQHILLLTGESEKDTPIDYIESAVKVLKKYFESITIEIYPLTTDEYKRLQLAGVDGLTIYQETYDVATYRSVHPHGPKSDYNFRIDAPERGAEAGLYSINIGALLGLFNWQEEVFHLGEHIKYLENKYSKTMYNISIPRIRPFKGQQFESMPITDTNLVQIMLALKLYLPSMGLNLSTRENKELREHLLPLGVARMSAGVTTSVGGHSEEKGDAQFEISDDRSVDDIKAMLIKKGYQPVLKDWVRI